VSKIETNLPTEVITALAEACGFSVAYDRSPGANTWTLSHGHGISYVQHTGTREAVCAFLIGYADMGLLTSQALNDLDNEKQKLILDVRVRLGGVP
jgi:hypothetical protein